MTLKHPALDLGHLLPCGDATIDALTEPVFLDGSRTRRVSRFACAFGEASSFDAIVNVASNDKVVGQSSALNLACSASSTAIRRRASRSREPSV